MSTSGGQRLQNATAHLTAAALATLFSAPTTLIPAPGANRAITVLGITWETVPGSTLYNAVDGGLYYAGLVVTGNRIDASLGVLLMTSGGGFTPEVITGLTSFHVPVATASLVNKAVIVSMPLANPERFGPIVTSSLANGGAGYVIGDTGTLDVQDVGAPAAYVVDTVGGGGTVLTYHLTAVGAAYSTAENPVTTVAGGSQPGIGTGLTLNITAISPADGDLYVTAFYETITTH